MDMTMVRKSEKCCFFSLSWMISSEVIEAMDLETPLLKLATLVVSILSSILSMLRKLCSASLWFSDWEPSVSASELFLSPSPLQGQSLQRLQYPLHPTERVVSHFEIGYFVHQDQLRIKGLSTYPFAKTFLTVKTTEGTDFFFFKNPDFVSMCPVLSLLIRSEGDLSSVWISSGGPRLDGLNWLSWICFMMCSTVWGSRADTSSETSVIVQLWDGSSYCTADRSYVKIQFMAQDFISSNKNKSI